jgi:hypothetical protein
MESFYEVLSFLDALRPSFAFHSLLALQTRLIENRETLMRYVPRYEQAIRSCFTRCTRVWKEQRMKKVVSVVILCLSTLCLSACAILNVGPCYGVGCPTFASTKSAPAQQTTTQNTPDAKTHSKVETKNTAVPEAQSTRGQ